MSNRLAVVLAFKNSEGGDVESDKAPIVQKLVVGFIEMMEQLGFTVATSAGMTVDAFEWQPTRTYVSGEDINEAIAYRLAHPDEIGDQPLRLNLFVDDDDIRRQAADAADKVTAGH